jgi:hypothetical protein
MRETTSLIPIGRIDQLIFLVRGHRVMLDRDLATLYGVQTRVLNQAVRRHMDRFPNDFLYSLTRQEVMSISQIVTSSEIKFSKHVFAFPEQGVAMLSSVLNSPRAVQVNIEIMRAFVRLREVISTNRELAQKLAELERRNFESRQRNSNHLRSYPPVDDAPGAAAQGNRFPHQRKRSALPSQEKDSASMTPEQRRRTLRPVLRVARMARPV